MKSPRLLISLLPATAAPVAIVGIRLQSMPILR
jgi:hypothetical protein